MLIISKKKKLINELMMIELQLIHARVIMTENIGEAPSFMAIFAKLCLSGGKYWFISL